MKVVILCGGMGTRMREETEYRPKPMVLLGNRPILWHIMKIYGRYGWKDFVICLGYKGHMIKDYFLNYEFMNSDFTIRLGDREKIQIHSNHNESDWSVTLAETGERTLTGGRVKRIEKYIDSNDFMLTYGDGVADIDIGKLYEFHRNHGHIGTMTGVVPVSRFGEVSLERGKVTCFNEKPRYSDGRVNGGFFVFNRKFFSYLDDDESCVLEKGPLENLAADGELMLYPHDGFWQCVDTYRELEALNEMWNSGKAPWRAWD